MNTFSAPIPMSRKQRQIVHMACSLFLDYPSPTLLLALDAVEQQIDFLPDLVAKELKKFCDHIRLVGIRSLAEHYVTTFDQRRRCSLYLSYFAVGDTRQRGAALVAFQDALRVLGFELARNELPDHLCVILEASALAESKAHATLVDMLSAHRDGLEVLRTALEQLGSPYVHVIQTVCMSLPQIDQETADHYYDLIRQGPPAELVGIGTPLPFPTTMN
ncbi:nitrate reductase molybdenum cofactor assembly chaperone [Corynebacterium freiburgense]|uniref:nitrate reductase molybdenum cofactor assembly chaperone n=1 Tax=Corynebacterium freiburgense TaxID=556548 RepID=UPI00042A545B|nr:nitrate reductase molybdenum cofactor assembly chaperone [Corynebacterium freiburgense]WJZ02351.1 Nitrate reductase-like protein NarX [Corynebacterium freiburgense]